MKRAFLSAATAIAIAGGIASFTAPARADEMTAPVLDESADAWLHEHCAYRGMGLLVESSSAGRVVETVGAGSSSFHKAFLCATTPPFWKGAWSPASIEAVACTEPRKTDEVCVPPLVREEPAAQPATPVGLPSPAIIRRLPPEMPEPTPPKKKRAIKQTALRVAKTQPR